MGWRERGVVTISWVNPFRKLNRSQSHLTWISFLVFVLIAYNLYFVCKIKQQELEEREAEVQRLRAEISLGEFTNSQLRAQVAHLSTDAGAEEVVRQKLGLVKNGEVSFVVLGGPTETKPAAKPQIDLPKPKRGVIMSFMHWFFIG